MAPGRGLVITAVHALKHCGGAEDVSGLVRSLQPHRGDKVQIMHIHYLMWPGFGSLVTSNLSLNIF